MRPPPAVDTTRINSEIRALQVRVIDNDGKQLGVMPVRDALNMATERMLDLVEVAPNDVSAYDAVAAKMGIQIIEVSYLGTRQLNLRVARDVAETTVVEAMPQFDGRSMIMLLAPPASTT